MKVSIQYYASFREGRGLGEEVLELQDDLSAADFFDSLRAEHQFDVKRSKCRVAINDAFAPWESILKDGDQVVFIPPVGGG
jgi:molybdopterin converting factor small subunit